MRGAAAIAVILVVVGGGIAATLSGSLLDYYAKLPQQQEEKTRREANAAKNSLLTYMLLRAENPLNIAQGTTGSVAPRLLMLPCPDNVGDNKLDGTQDPHCGVINRAKSNRVNNILDGGSRFGRLPWRAGNTSATGAMYDGLGKDFHDGAGNRFWYAVSRNLAPIKKTKKTEPRPLNLHRLATLEENWLTVTGEFGQTLAGKAAAVVLAPGRALNTQQRISESVLSEQKFVYPKDVTAANAALSPKNYFETLSVSLAGLSADHSNNNKNGVFVRAKTTPDFNDIISYISLSDLMSTEKPFYRSYLKLVGVSKTHNAPAANRPLAEIKNALSEHRRRFGFYPVPAANTTAALNTRQRLCDVRTTNNEVTVTIPGGADLLAAATITVAEIPAAVTVTTPAFSLTAAADFLFINAQTVFVSPPTSATILTLAASLSIAVGPARFFTNASLHSPTVSLRTLPAGATIALAADTTVTINAGAALFPTTTLGWFATLSAGTTYSLSSPPCFGTLSLSRKLQTFIEDQPIFYAVSENCHYGNGGKNCGQDGFTVSITAGATVALPRPATITVSFPPHSVSVARQPNIPLIISATITAAIAKLSADVTLSAGAQITLPENTAVVFQTPARFNNVEALLIYSPAPLFRVSCTLQMSAAIFPQQPTLASQQTANDNITPLCYWLDDMENANEDNTYIIRPPVLRRAPALHNDYFILFGGDLDFSP